MAAHQLHLPSQENLPLHDPQTEEEEQQQQQEQQESAEEIEKNYDIVEEIEKNYDIVEEIEKNYDIVEEIEKITSYRFKNPNLLQQAFTDSTYEEDCSSYQRLEFYGDSVINNLVAEELYFLYPDLDPGNLTRLRAANVDTEKLARVAINYSFHRYLRHKRPLLAGQIEEFKEAIMEYPLHSYGLVDAPKVLADIVESLIGAIQIDSNRSRDTTLQVVKKLLDPMITLETLQMHPVTRLFELCQKHGVRPKFVDLKWNQSGEIEVYVDEEFAGRGKYRSKKLVAINRAADNAYKQIATKFSTLQNIDNDENNM